MKHLLSRYLLVLGLMLLSTPPAIAELIIGDYEVVSQKRLSLTEFEYTATAHVTNTSDNELKNVTATLRQDNHSFLRVQGRDIVDGNGNTIILRGVNLDNNHWMEGADPMEYAARADIQFIDELGMTVIRVALDWHYFQTSLGYELIDRYLAWCESTNIYAIISMQVVPPDEEFGQNRIWGDPTAQQQFIDLWTAIATRYADNPVVAGYDPYNEPAPADQKQWWDLAARVVTAVRSVDTNHILFVENPVYPLFSGFQLLDDPNIVYSYHDYTPFVVTHAGADWVADSPIPDDYAYPGPALEGIEWANWSPDAAVFTGSTSDWLYWDSGVLTPPADVEFATLKPAVIGNVGRVWFDDLEVLQNGIPQPIYNPGAEEASFVYEGAPANWFFWSETGFTGTWSDEVAHSGTHSLQITGTGNGYGTWGQSTGFLSEPLFPIAPGDTFQVRGWLYAPENNGGSIALGLDYLNGVYTDYNRDQLVADIQPYVDWAAANNVPLFVGEFGAMTTSPGDSRYRLVADKVSVMNEANLHWAYWTFRYDGDHPEAGHSGLYLHDQLDERLAEILRVSPSFGTLQFSSATYSVREAGGSASIIVKRINGSDGAVSVDCATSDGTATAGSDYIATSSTLNWADGDAADKTFTITITDDNLSEGDETFSVTLTDPINGNIVGSAIVTISDNDYTVVTLVDFTATALKNEIVLEWGIAYELDNAGFHIWRATGEGWKFGDYSTVIRLTEQLLSPISNSSWYSYVDEDVETGLTYYYGLEDLDVYGHSTFHWDYIDSATAK